MPLDFLCRLKGNETIEDRFVPRDDHGLIARGRPEGRQRKHTVIAAVRHPLGRAQRGNLPYYLFDIDWLHSFLSCFNQIDHLLLRSI